MRKLFPSHRYYARTMFGAGNPKPTGPILLLRISSKAQHPVLDLDDVVLPKPEADPPSDSPGPRGSTRVSHMWPEWVDLMEMLIRRGYFEGSENLFREGQLGTKETNSIRAACLGFARERFGLIRFLPRKDIQVITGFGCPSVDRKVVNSGKRLRAHVGVNEGDVCSSCNLRGNCDRAYVKAREDEPGRTVDVMRFVLTYGLDVVSGKQENRLLHNKMITESVRRLLKEMVENSSQQLNSSEPSDTQSEAHLSCYTSPKEKGHISVPMKQGDWICPKCNFLNFAKNIKCLRCDGLSQEKLKQIQEDQEHLPLKKGDWICEKCNFLNFAKNTRCLLCQAKPPKRHLNPGEWECESCNYINFRRNMKCLKCEHKRPKASNSSKVMMQLEYRNGGHTGSGSRLPRDGEASGLEYVVSSKNQSGSWSFVEEGEHKISSNEGFLFADFPIVGGSSSLSQNVQKRERWKAEISERYSGEKDKDEEFQQVETPGRLKHHESSDDEDLVEWFGYEKKLEKEGSGPASPSECA